MTTTELLSIGVICSLSIAAISILLSILTKVQITSRLDALPKPLTITSQEAADPAALTPKLDKINEQYERHSHSIDLGPLAFKRTKELEARIAALEARPH